MERGSDQRVVIDILCPAPPFVTRGGIRREASHAGDPAPNLARLSADNMPSSARLMETAEAAADSPPIRVKHAFAAHT
jgi:hypothetical protein